MLSAKNMALCGLILYLLACGAWLRLGLDAEQAAPELLIGGDWLGLPFDAEARQLILRDLKQRTYRLPRSLSSERLSNSGAMAQDGWVLDDELLSVILKQALPGAKIYPFYRSIAAEFRNTDQEQLTEIIGSWYSGSGGTVGRARNVQLACAAIEGRIIWPGEIFSFNEATGPTTLERGYENAIVIVNGAFVQGPGGGVCQVASTLHCALQEAGLLVIERHRHSLPVGYVPPDRDATVSFGSLDLRFENDTGWPLVIRAASDGYSVWVELITINN